MIKHGQVRVGVTPSEESGRPSETLKDGAPVRHDESPGAAHGLRKLATVLDEQDSPKGPSHGV